MVSKVILMYSRTHTSQADCPGTIPVVGEINANEQGTEYVLSGSRLTPWINMVQNINVGHNHGINCSVFTKARTAARLVSLLEGLQHRTEFLK